MRPRVESFRKSGFIKDGEFYREKDIFKILRF